jgi:hypothetical protein
MRIILSVFVAIVSLVVTLPARQSPGTDLDQLMERVLARRDENWKKLQQYVLDERETFDLAGPGGARLYGFRRDYTWFLREGVFVRSPLRADGVTLSEDQRRKAESEWLRREKRRAERRRADATRIAGTDNDAAGVGTADTTPPAADPADATLGPPGDTTVSATAIEPAFVSHAYFLRFKFEPNHYALVGRESLDGRPVLKIEYYPTALFTEGRTRPNRRARDRDADIEEKMNKVSMITLWVDRDRHQILQYTFDDIDMDFLPGRTLARVDDVRATMRMGQPFPDVWLPKDIEMRFRMALAVGPVDARYRVEYHDYRQADVTYKIR